MCITCAIVECLAEYSFSSLEQRTSIRGLKEALEVVKISLKDRFDCPKIELYYRAGCNLKMYSLSRWRILRVVDTILGENGRCAILYELHGNCSFQINIESSIFHYDDGVDHSEIKVKSTMWSMRLKNGDRMWNHAYLMKSCRRNEGKHIDSSAYDSMAYYRVRNIFNEQ